MIAGARQGVFSGIRKLVAYAMARDLSVYIIPGPEIAGVYGLDIEATGMKIVASPRHASVLLLIGEIPEALREAAAVIYAQMMRPRLLFTLGTNKTSPLPVADIVAANSQHDLIKGVAKLRKLLAKGAFYHDISDFDAAILQVRIEYICSMHPEIVRDEPGSCPKCGMNLVPREAQAKLVHSHKETTASDHSKLDFDALGEYTCPMHPEVVQGEPGSCPKCGMNLEPREIQPEENHEQHDSHHHSDHDAKLEYTCPMHPEVVQGEPGSCPKCGMNLEPREIQPEENHEQHASHHHTDHNVPLEYICPMHPDVMQSEPGSCPKCGMTLEARAIKTQENHEQHDSHHHSDHDAKLEYTCPMHPEVVQGEPGSCPKCGMNLEPREIQPEENHEQHDSHHHSDHDAKLEYTCPMHPEVVQGEPGSCPKCGMYLEPREKQNLNHSHDVMGTDMDHGSMEFMSMVSVTKDLPRSTDGLAMDWINVPFGPFFPGLPGGLLLMLTLDGDTVADSSVNTLVGRELLLQGKMTANNFTERFKNLDPLAPICYQVLASLAIENTVGIEVDEKTEIARLIFLERERIVSHLGWLALFGRQTGFDWLMYRAMSMQRNFLQAGIKQIAALKTKMSALNNRLRLTPLLKSRTSGIGSLLVGSDKNLFGPVARASGINNDTRSNNKFYTELGFVPAIRKQGDARARLQLRIDEINNSLVLIEEASKTFDSTIDALDIYLKNKINTASGAGEAVIETARGMARLKVNLEKGLVLSAELETPSTHHLTLVAQLTHQQELGDALVAVGSLDLSPWEIRP